LSSLGNFLFANQPSISRFEVHTSFLVAVVKGTSFSVDVANDNASVNVREGVVGVTETEGGNTVDVVAGQAAVANPGLGHGLSVGPSASADGLGALGKGMGLGVGIGNGNGVGQGAGAGNASSNASGNEGGNEGGNGGGNEGGNGGGNANANANVNANANASSNGGGKR